MKKVLLNHKMISSSLLRVCPKVELLIVANARHITNQSQLTSTYAKPQTINRPNLPKNMILRHCSPSISLMDPMMQSVSITSVRRPLTVILAWMLAKDQHLEKYRQFWFRRGFDVLTVRTTPLDLLLPPIGGRIVASNLVKYLTEINSQYNEIVVHAFSVGGYQFGETLYKIRSNDQYKHIQDSIKGIILDSMVYTEDAAPGLSRAITRHPIAQPILENSIYAFLKLFRNISVKNYLIASEQFFNPFYKCPGLILYSEDDIVSSVESNRRLAQTWKERGISVQTKCWANSTHVLHYKEHQSEYEEQVDTFLKKLKLRNCNVY